MDELTITEYPFPGCEEKPHHWKSLKTGNEYPYPEYINHGKGGTYKGFKDLPQDEYPYSLVYIQPQPAWINKQ